MGVIPLSDASRRPSRIPVVTASIIAVMGAFLVTYPHDRIRSLLILFVFVRTAYIPAALLVGVWFLTQLVSLGAVAHNPQPAGGVAYAAHVGGFIFGCVTARLFEAGRQPSFASVEP